jgi:hypothetical protein
MGEDADLSMLSHFWLFICKPVTKIIFYTTSSMSNVCEYEKETPMPYINTLRHRLAYVGTILPNTLLEATNHAVDLGAVATTRGGVPYFDTMQELTACKPELLDLPASLVVYDAGQEKGGMIFLEGDTQVLFLFHSVYNLSDRKEYRPSIGKMKP